MTKTDPFAALGTFAPKERPPETATPEKAAVEEVAERHGFSARNFGPDTERKRYFRKPGERGAAMTQAGIRVRISDWNKFQAFCQANRLTAGEGFEELVKRLPEP